MAHMFKLDFICNHVNSMVESGQAVVVAELHEQAVDIVCTQLGLPPSRTRCESVKVKPPCHVVRNHQSHPNARPVVRNGAVGPVQHYQLAVLASNVHGTSEEQIIRKVGEELSARGVGRRLAHGLDMSVEVWPVSKGAGGAASALERIEMYGSRRGKVSGGRVGGRR